MTIIRKKHVEAAVTALNRAARLANLPATYQLDHCNGGYKLTTNDGSSDVWNDRLPAKEFYNRVWAFNAGIQAGSTAKPTDPMALNRAELQQLIDLTQYRMQHIREIANGAEINPKTSPVFMRLDELQIKLQILRDREP